MAKLELTFFSQAMEMNTTVSVLLPDKLEKNEKLRPFYVLHGYNGDHQDWTRFTSIERYMWQYRACVIMPSGFNAYYTDHQVGLAYETYFIEELVPYMERVLPLLKEAYILGLSMGGYGAMKFALGYPKKFIKGASLSGVMNPDFIRTLPWMGHRLPVFDKMFGKQVSGKNDLRNLVLKDIKKGTLPQLMLTCGTDDFLVEDNRSFKKFLDDHQVNHTFIFDEGEHSWEYWDRNLQKALPFLFSN